MTYTCDHCDEEFTHAPVMDAEESRWVPADARRAWCSQECLDNAGEAYGVARAEGLLS